jgi:hypothetical protein
MDLYRDHLTSRRGRLSRFAISATSAAIHAAIVLLVFVLTLHSVKVHPIRPTARCCMVALYQANGVGIDAPPIPHPGTGSHQAKKTVVRQKSLLPTPPEPVVQEAQTSTAGNTSAHSAGSPAPPQPASQLTAGTGSGSDDAQPAYPIFSPSPHVADRTLLPGANQNVIVDVDVSVSGEVTNEKLVQGLGNGIDQLVLDTVKGWHFHPATVNGNAVASTSELVFPFNRSYPRSNG